VATPARACSDRQPTTLDELQVLLETFAKLKPQADLSTYYTNEYLAEPPYLPKK